MLVRLVRLVRLGLNLLLVWVVDAVNDIEFWALNVRAFQNFLANICACVVVQLRTVLPKPLCLRERNFMVQTREVHNTNGQGLGSAVQAQSSPVAVLAQLPHCPTQP